MRGEATKFYKWRRDSFFLLCGTPLFLFFVEGNSRAVEPFFWFINLVYGPDRNLKFFFYFLHTFFFFSIWGF